MVGKKDDLLLDMLAFRVPVLSVTQITRAFSKPSRSAKPNTRKRLKRLRGAGCLTEYRVLSYPMPKGAGKPVFAWEYG